MRMAGKKGYGVTITDPGSFMGRVCIFFRVHDKRQKAGSR